MAPGSRASKLRGRSLSPEHREKISRAHTGRALSPEHVEAIRTHGMSGHPSFPRHKSMMSRCYTPTNKAYPHYGGRGIEVLAEWHDVRAFCAWLDDNLGPCPPGHSLDRIDNDRGYEPGNVRWATQASQLSNRRRVHKTLTCAWCDEHFEAARADARYCSGSCASKAARQRARDGSRKPKC